MNKARIREQRQEAYKRRAKRARFFGRMMIPAAMLTFSGAMWSEPDIAEKLEAGLQEFEPIATAVAAKLGMTRPVEEDTAQLEEEQIVPTDNGLPASQVRVNRP